MPSQSPLVRAARQVCKWALLALVLTAPPPFSAFAAESAPVATPATVVFDSEQQILDVSTVDRHWRIALQPKSLLGKSFEQAANQASVQSDRSATELPRFYDGEVLDAQDSWARMTFTPSAGDIFTGYVFIAGELFELQHREELGGHTLSHLSGDASLADFQLPQTRQITAPPSDASATELSENGTETSASQSMAVAISSSNRLATQSTGAAPRAMKIGIAIDSLYNERYNGQGLAHALNIINGVDGIYQNQLGLAVVVDSYKLYDDPEQDPLRNYQGGVDQVLGAFRDIRSAEPELPADLALVHLFSGQANPQNTIGLGWIDTACRLDGYDLSMSTPFPYDMLLAAHEIAHNLGAEHDDDTQCSHDPGIDGSQVMWSELSSKSEAVFSACSLSKMQHSLTSSCVLDNIDVGVDLATLSGEATNQLDVSVNVTNHDSSRSATQLASVTRFPSGTRLSGASAGCTILDSQLNCQHGALAPSGFETLSVSAEFSPNLTGESQISTELTHPGFTDSEQLDNAASIKLNSDGINLNPTASSLPAQGNEGPQADQGSGGGSAGGGSISPVSLLLAALLSLFSFSWRRR